MSMIASRVKSALSTVRKLVYQTEAEILSKQKESFLKGLREIAEEKKKPGYNKLVMAEIANMDPFGTTPKTLANPMHLVWDYESKSNQVVNWLGELALNKEEDADYREEAVSCFEHTSNPQAIDYLTECLKDEEVSIHLTALHVIAEKISSKWISDAADTKPFTVGIDDFLEIHKIKEHILDKLKFIEEVHDKFMNSLIQASREHRKIETKVNILDELKRLRRELMESLARDIGEPRAKAFLIRIALDDFYENLKAEYQAFLVLRENNGLEDLTSHIRNCFPKKVA